MAEWRSSKRLDTRVLARFRHRERVHAIVQEWCDLLLPAGHRSTSCCSFSWVWQFVSRAVRSTVESSSAYCVLTISADAACRSAPAFRKWTPNALRFAYRALPTALCLPRSAPSDVRRCLQPRAGALVPAPLRPSWSGSLRPCLPRRKCSTNEVFSACDLIVITLDCTSGSASARMPRASRIGESMDGTMRMRDIRLVMWPRSVLEDKSARSASAAGQVR
jgi:hypothetical protein